MELVNITDNNYAAFKQSERAVLVASTTWCPPCNLYKPVVQAVADLMHNVTFGVAVLDIGRLGQFKREHPFPDLQVLPLTLGMTRGQEIFRLTGEYGLDILVKELTTRFASYQAGETAHN